MSKWRNEAEKGYTAGGGGGGRDQLLAKEGAEAETDEALPPRGMCGDLSRAVWSPRPLPEATSGLFLSSSGVPTLFSKVP